MKNYTAQEKKRIINAYDFYQRTAKQGKRIVLSDVYKKPSETKKDIWENIFYDSLNLHGERPVLITYNTFMFTAGFTYSGLDYDSIFKYYTPNFTYDIPVSTIKYWKRKYNA